MTPEKTKLLELIVSDLEVRKAAQSIIARLNRAKANPANMGRGAQISEHWRKVKAGEAVHRPRGPARKPADVEAGIIRPEVYQAGRGSAEWLEELVNEKKGAEQ